MGFEMFSVAHKVGLLAAAIVFAGIILFRKQLRRKEWNRVARYGLAIILLCCEASLQISYLLEQSWNVGSMPFQLCSLMVMLGAVLLMTSYKKLYSVLFFLGSMGALQALLTPNLDETFPHFRYFNFFIAHIGIIGAALFITAVERYRPTFRSVIQAWLWLHILAIPAAITNLATGTTNFMFLAGKPRTASLLDMLAPWPWYLLQLEAVVILIFLLLFYFTKLVDFLLRLRSSGHSKD